MSRVQKAAAYPIERAVALLLLSFVATSAAAQQDSAAKADAEGSAFFGVDGGWTRKGTISGDFAYTDSGVILGLNVGIGFSDKTPPSDIIDTEPPHSDVREGGWYQAHDLFIGGIIGGMPKANLSAPGFIVLAGVRLRTDYHVLVSNVTDWKWVEGKRNTATFVFGGEYLFRPFSSAFIVSAGWYNERDFVFGVATTL